MKALNGRWTRGIGMALLVVALGACRQPDGEMPAPRGEQPNKIEDISRDLQNLAGRDANAPSELADDISSLDSMQRPPERVVAVSQGMGKALAGANLSDADAQKMATLLFVAASARDLSEAQIDQVASDLRESLVSVGADPAAADQASEAASALASDLTRNRKRWYHR